MTVTCTITVGGRPIQDPMSVLRSYLGYHGATIVLFDWLAGTKEAIDSEIVRAATWVGARVSPADGDLLIELAKGAPWEHVPVDARLIDADPLVRGGLYDRAEQLHSYFRQGVSPHCWWLLSVVLYLMRPGLISFSNSPASAPLRSLYDEPAAAVVRRVAEVRPEFASRPTMYWEAIREDLARSEAGLAELRAALRELDDQFSREVGQRLSDIRLLDILGRSLI